ncbi:hypothetical protein [Nocardia mexicana]|uniref:hypothetical protein n=1 Tax=Nocardia mexicana TaxID=279262 RepID=UPI00083574DC|nr:hypothetical protein [Nocardia mexicana]
MAKVDKAVGADSVRRHRLARLDATAAPGRSQWSQAPARFEPGLQPTALLPYAGGAASPVTFRY